MMRRINKAVKISSLIVAGVIVGTIALLFTLGIFYDPDFSIPGNLKGQHVLINGMKIRYYQVGQGPDLVFLHGGMGSIEDFQPLYNDLQNRYRITAFDRPGMGYSEIKNQAYTLESTTEIVTRLIEKLNLKHPVIFGHSHGGAVALNLAVKNTKEIKGYILLAPAAYYYERFGAINKSLPMKLLRLPRINTGIAMSVGSLIGDGMIDKTLRRMMAENPGFPEDFISFRRELWNKPVSTITRAWQMKSFCDHIQPLSTQYGNIDKPVLIVQGTKDSQDIQDSATRLSKVVKKSQLQVINNSGHYAQFDSTHEVIQAVDTFMKKINTPAK